MSCNIVMLKSDSTVVMNITLFKFWTHHLPSKVILGTPLEVQSLILHASNAGGTEFQS